MATGRGDFPFQSIWFRSGRSPASARVLLRTSTAFDPVVKTAFGNFFYPLGPHQPVANGVSSLSTTPATSHAVALPPFISSGDLLVIFFAINASPSNSITTPSGWTALANVTRTDVYGIYARIADGSEGSSVTFTVANSQNFAAVAYRLTGCGPTLTTSDVLVTADSNDGTSATANPPSVTPGWSSSDGFYIAAAFSAAGTAGNELAAYPSGYDLAQVFAFPNATSSVSVAAAIKQAASGTEDPAAFSFAGATQRTAYTVAVRRVPTSISASLSATLGAVSASAAGAVRVAGAAAVAVGDVALSSAATVRVEGQASQSLGAIGVASAATVRVAGSLAATLGDVTVSSAGSVVAAGGFLAVTLDNVTAAAAGAVRVAGQSAITLGGVAPSAAGIVRVAGAAALTLGSVGVAAQGSVRVTGSLGITLGAVSVSSAGVVSSGSVGTLAVTLGPIVTALAGTVRVLGSSSILLSSVSLGALGAVRVQGQLSRTLNAITVVSEVRKPGGKIHVYEGEQRPKAVKHWTGTEWKTGRVAHWNGTIWKTSKGD